MNRIRHALALVAASTVLAASAQAATLSVDLTGIRAAKGELRIALVDANGYDGGAKPVAATIVAAQGATARAVFADVAPGRYAVMVVHDENGNGQLDTNMLGMPTEGYGFSNNPNVMRKPTFDEAAFAFDGDTTVDVAIR